LKSVLTLPKLAPAFTPAYQPVQLYTGAEGAGIGALTGISAAKAGVPINPATAIMVASLLIVTPKTCRILPRHPPRVCCRYGTVKEKSAENLENALMSALGQKQTSEHVREMSALPPKADIRVQVGLRS